MSSAAVIPPVTKKMRAPKRKAEEVVEVTSPEEDAGTRKKKKTKNLKKLYPEITGARTGFQLYIKMMSTESKASGEKLKAIDIVPLWKNVKDRSAYVKAAEEDKLRFVKELVEKGHVFSYSEEKRFRPQLESLNYTFRPPRPHRPPPPFFYYLKMNREKIMKERGCTSSEVLKIIGDMWKNTLTDAQREEWKELSKQAA